MHRIIVVVLLASSIAHAEEALPPVEEAEPARVWLLDLTVQTEIGLDDGDAGDPVSVAPDLSLVAKGMPQFDIVHSSQAITGFHGMIRGTSLCVSGDACDAYSTSVYHNAGVQVGYTLRSHVPDEPWEGDVNQTAMSVTGGLIANSFDPFALALKLGVRGSFLSRDSIQIQLVPSVHVALNERDTQPDRLFVPLTLTVVPSQKLTLQLETGIAAPLDHFSDNLQVPLGVNVDITGSNGIDLLASFTFPAAHGGDAVLVTGMDARVLTVGLRFSKFLGGEAQ